MSSEIKIGCEVTVFKNNMLLLGERKNCYGAGDWGLPGGHLEFGEKTVEAAQRELQEETGIENVQLVLAHVVDDPRGDQHYLHIVFKLENFDGEIQLREPDRCAEWRFFALDNLPNNIFIGHKKIVETIKDGSQYAY